MSINVDKENVIYIYIIYGIKNSAIEMEILPFNTRWMDLVGTMLNEISHTEKEKTIESKRIELRTEWRVEKRGNG